MKLLYPSLLQPKISQRSFFMHSVMMSCQQMVYKYSKNIHLAMHKIRSCMTIEIYHYSRACFLDDSDSQSMKAIRCLALFLTPKNKKKSVNSTLDVPYLVAEAPVSCPPFLHTFMLYYYIGYKNNAHILFLFSVVHQQRKQSIL